jgi:hypothetical protein
LPGRLGSVFAQEAARAARGCFAFLSAFCAAAQQAPAADADLPRLLREFPGCQSPLADFQAEVWRRLESGHGTTPERRALLRDVAALLAVACEPLSALYVQDVVGAEVGEALASLAEVLRREPAEAAPRRRYPAERVALRHPCFADFLQGVEVGRPPLLPPAEAPLAAEAARAHARVVEFALGLVRRTS